MDNVYTEQAIETKQNSKQDCKQAVAWVFQSAGGSGKLGAPRFCNTGKRVSKSSAKKNHAPRSKRLDIAEPRIEELVHRGSIVRGARFEEPNAGKRLKFNVLDLFWCSEGLLELQWLQKKQSANDHKY